MSRLMLVAFGSLVQQRCENIMNNPNHLSNAAGSDSHWYVGVALQQTQREGKRGTQTTPLACSRKPR